MAERISREGPRLGLVVPPQEGKVPADAPLVYPDIGFESVGLGLQRMEFESYDAASARIAEKAGELAARGVAAIGVMGTSLTFFQGRAGNIGIERLVREETGLPCVTMSTALTLGLSGVGAKRPVLASAYSPEVHVQLAEYLREEGFDPAFGAHLNIVELTALDHVGPEDVVALGLRAWQEAGQEGDALVLSCGGFRTRGALLVLEEALGVPVISSAVAGLWAVVGAAGMDPRVPALGRFLWDWPTTPNGHRGAGVSGS